MNRKSFLRCVAGLGVGWAASANANVFTLADLAFLARAKRAKDAIVPANALRLTAAGTQAFNGTDVQSSSGYVAIRDATGAIQIVTSGNTFSVGSVGSFIELWSCVSSSDAHESGFLTQLAIGENAITQVDATVATGLTYLDIYGNDISSLNVANCSSLQTLYCYDNAITGLTLNVTALNDLDASANSLTQAQVDGVLTALAAGAVNNGTLSLNGGSNAAPSALGLTAKTTLEGRGWTVAVTP